MEFLIPGYFLMPAGITLECYIECFLNPYPAVGVCKAFANKLFATQSIFLSNFAQIDKTLMRSRRPCKADNIFTAGEELIC